MRYSRAVVLATAAAAVAAPATAHAASAAVIERVAVTRLTPMDATLTAIIDPGELETSYEVEMFGSCPEQGSRRDSRR